MVISNVRLPQIELPTDEILDDEDNKVLEAFGIILNSFKKAQKRTRTIKKAYNELESITLDLLQKFEDKETSPKNEANKPLVNKNHIGVNSSTPKLHNDRIKAGQSNDKQKQLGNEFSRNNCKNLELAVNPSTSEISRVAKKQDIRIEDETDNEENTPPFIDESPNRNDSSAYPDEARAVKVSLAKTIYTPETQKHRKTPKHKSLKQATLIFQPIATKTDLTLSQKKVTKKPDGAHNLGNLFDKDYHTKKKGAGEHSEETKFVDLTRQDKRSTSTPNSEKAKIDPPKKKVEIHTSRKSDSIIIIPTASQINETARSLFDDDDHDNFIISPDILNTCVDYTALDDSSQTDVKKDPGKIAKNHSVAGTSKVLQCVPLIDSIDETFFAPAEMNVLRSEKSLLAGSSKITDPCETSNEVRPFKRKSNDELIIDAADDFEDLALQDINWDAEISNDNWIPPENPNDSYHIPPQKTNKGPQYAHRENVERNMAKRSKLRGWDCAQCEKYYQSMDLPDSELEKRKNACSRHRSKFNPRYYTPKGFWNPEFLEAPDSSDYSDN